MWFCLCDSITIFTMISKIKDDVPGILVPMVDTALNWTEMTIVACVRLTATVKTVKIAIQPDLASIWNSQL